MAKRDTRYEIWMREEGIPVFEGYGVEDVTQLALRSWQRTGGKGSVFSPPSGWFHQHFNTGKEPARQLAFRYSGQSGKYLLGCWRAINKEGVRTSTREGGTLIEYQDEDPQMRSDFETAIKKIGVAMEMPQFNYAGL